VELALYRSDMVAASRASDQSYKPNGSDDLWLGSECRCGTRLVAGETV